MKPRCTEGTDAGDFVALRFDIPDQESVDKGEEPSIDIWLDDLATEIYSYNEALHRSAFWFMLTRFVFFLEAAENPESAETVAQWLDYYAEEVRKKFPK